jgi:hypothetical protein
MSATHRLPDKIKIGPYDIALKRMTHQEAGADYGQFCSRTQSIGLCEDFPSSFMEADTLMHEILHGIWWERDMRAKDGEERIVAEFSGGLTQVLRDNPGLLAWLRACLT